ncbi:conjugal transfer protein [Cohnella fermenti]|uniref:Conjugal transfer protein n=1 Tax=Cohnella fermenti TaxID=2565925 RepID=A0A4S4BJS5_9BACL|nr:conjugal transfer protein [Cohnella fermenti]THF74365.1 conjugal transfer protein [Cohnella fermenti]
MRVLSKILLWGLLLLSSLGAVATLRQSEPDMPSKNLLEQIAEQQMATETALYFVREWMDWQGDELPEARMARLRPYVTPEALARIAALQNELKTMRQKVMASEFMSLSPGGASQYTVRIRAIVLNPERVQWEADVPVWVQMKKGAVVTGLPLLRPVPETSTVPVSATGEAAVSADHRQRMQPAIESFLKAMCEGTDEKSLANYVTAEAEITPLAGRLRLVTLDKLEAVGQGPYMVTATFTAEEAATGYRFAQAWKLLVTEENGKFFISQLSA